MKITDLITDLQQYEFYYGDVDVVVDGDWDWEEPELAFSEYHSHLVIH